MSLGDAGIPILPEFLPGIRWRGRSPRGWALELNGVPVLYMSENRSLAVLEVLVHLSGTLPDKYVLGAADIPEDVAIERIADKDLPEAWSALSPREQVATRLLGDAGVARQRSAVLSVPSVILGERNYVLNPAHSDFARIEFAQPEAFRFDLRLISREPPLTDKEADRELV